MGHTVNYNHETDCIEIIVDGELTFDDAKSIVEDAATTFEKHKCYKFLTDFSKTKLSVNTFELYSFAELISETVSAAGIPLHKVKRAVLTGPEIADYDFLETLSVNRGHNLRIFDSLDKAKSWLIG